uniref:BESS domain-containing protein n=1 Tax=Globodera pallida TaxID=36090 RepID=A0A183CKT0_GLOPA
MVQPAIRLPLQSGFGAAKQFVTFSVNGSTSPARKKTQFQPPIRESHRRMPNPNFPSTTDGQFETQTAENSGGSANSSQQRAAVVENVFCPPSKLQKELYNSIQFLMTMRESEQHKLLRLLCNHPILLYQRVLELSGDLQHQATKRAKKEFINFSGVMCHFPTRYELSQCRIQDSG